MQIFKFLFSCLLTMSALASPSIEAASSGRTIGVRTSIFPILIGMVDANLDIAFGKLVISPYYLSWGVTISDYDYAISGFGGDINYHLSGGLADSWYIGAGYRTLKITTEDVTTEGELNTSGYSVQGGYSWVWSLLYMNLGVQHLSFGESDIVIKDKSTGADTGDTKSSPVSGAGLYWSLGFAF